MIRVLLVDDDAMVRVGLSLVLGGDPGIEVVGEAADGAAAVEAAARLSPDVVLMDIRMSGMDGLTATEALRGGPAVIVLTTFDADEHILRALRGGAAGFLLKDTPPRDILAAVRRVAAGESTLSPSVLARLIEHVVGAGTAEAPGLSGDPGMRAGGSGSGGGSGAGGGSARARAALAALAHLTEREREVAYAVAEGRGNAEIAADLFMSVATVKAYVSRILTRTGCVNRVQIAILVHESWM